MKTLSILFLLAISVLNYAQNVNENAFFYSNNEQNRIDALDGKLDQTIDFGKPDATLRATFVYFNLVDSIENSIKNLKNATDGEKKNYIANLYLTLKNINDKNIGLLSFHEKLFAQIINVLQAKENNQLESELYRNVYASLQIIPFYKLAPETKPFLIAAASIYPDEVLKKE